MKKLWILSVSMLLVGLLAGSGLNVVANSASDDSGISKDQYSKLTNAILSLHKRISSLETATKSAKGSAGTKANGESGDKSKETQELLSKLAQTQSEVSSLKSQISGLQADANANREAIVVLHRRLTLFDSKSGTIKF